MASASRADDAASRFEARAHRAAALVTEHESAATVLRFVGGLAREQARVARAIAQAHSAGALSGRLGEDGPRIVESLRGIARFAALAGPQPLRDLAASRAAESTDVACRRLVVAWENGTARTDDWLARAMLRPWAETARALERLAPRRRGERTCPVCGGLGAIAARRGGSESEGAARSLVCGWCGSEWSVPRIECISCANREPARLPVFSTSTHPGVRLEACDVCRRYVKSIDLSDDARREPEIDDVASLALDLWAADEGYARIEPGLAGA